MLMSVPKRDAGEKEFARAARQQIFSAAFARDIAHMPAPAAQRAAQCFAQTAEMLELPVAPPVPGPSQLAILAQLVQRDVRAAQRIASMRAPRAGLGACAPMRSTFF